MQIRTPDQRLRVFVSSTLGELAEERQAARAAVEQLRLAPIMFELGARPHPPRALYRAYLAQSDVFVGIYWQRYGWIAPDMEISGLEDELVLSRGMPRLVYVKRPAPDIDPRLAEMLARLQDEDAVSYKPFSDAAELRNLLVDDLAVMLTERFVDTRSRLSTKRMSALPARTSTFLGREEALRELRDLIVAPEPRLVTLSGPGGTGKTRLAIEAARSAAQGFAGGVVFVDVSAEREPEGVFAAVARATDATGAAEAPLDALETALADQSLLLVIDNLEQVTEAGVGIVRLLEALPRLKVVVTSREPLRVRGETVYPVPPLSLPTPASPTDRTAVDAALTSEAVRLFVERATAVDPEFRMTDANVGDVVAICARLDGLPLAIELAAARVRLLGPDELRAALDSRRDVLTTAARDAPKRQQTLRDTIEWSYELLTDAERKMFCFFAAFVDARLADLEAAANQVSVLDGIDVIDAMGSLVDKSLVRSSVGPDGRPRFSMLQTIRDYATAQLDADAHIAATVRRAHAVHYTAAALRLYAGLTFEDRAHVLAALSADLVNFRAAWTYWVAEREVERLSVLLEPLWGYYEARGEYRTAIELGMELLEIVAMQPESEERRRDEYALQVNIARTQQAFRGFTQDAEQAITDVLDRYGPETEVRQRFVGLRSLASLEMMRTNFERVAKIVRDLMAIAEAEGDHALLCEAHLLNGVSRIWNEDLEGGIEQVEEAIAEFKATTSGFVEFRVGPNPGVVAHAVSGLMSWMAGRGDTAVTRLQEAVQVARDLEHPYSIAYALHHAALLDVWRGDFGSVGERAHEMLAIAEQHEYSIWQALALVLSGTARVAAGEVERGLALVEEGFARYEGLTTAPVFWPMLLLMRAGAYATAGRIEDALACCDEASATTTPVDPMAADILIMRGRLLLQQSPEDPRAAEELFAQAYQVAVDHGARLNELEAATHLAILRRGTPGESNALARLRSVLDAFTEGFDTAPVIAARAALAPD